jgi:Na+/melibiose symporter-like transporter
MVLRSESREERLLYGASTVSEFGVAFSSGAVLVIAVDELGASALTISVAFGLARLIAALCSYPIGVAVEQRLKRPVLVRTDLLRSLSTLAIVVLLLSGHLSTWMLAALLGVDVLLSITSSAAYDAHLKDLLPRERWAPMYSRFEVTFWVLTATCTPLGGAAVAWFGPMVTLGIDAVTYAVSALLLLRIRTPERRPTTLAVGGLRALLSQSASGWRYIRSVPALRALFRNAMFFGGSLVMVSPLLAVMLLRDLGLSPLYYGFVLGVPAVGGVVGAWLSPRLVGRFGQRSTLLWFGSLRTIWTVWLAFTPDGLPGFFFVLAVESLLMLTAGVFNPVYATYSTSIIDDDFMARTRSTWHATAMVVQPLFMVVGGLASGLIGVRSTIFAAGVLLAATSVMLPWRALVRDPVHVSRSDAWPRDPLT